MMKSSRGAAVLREFGSPALGIVALLMALSLQISHTQIVIWLNSVPAGEELKSAVAAQLYSTEWILSLTGAIAFELATLWFIATGNRWASYVFAAFGVAMNVNYYELRGYDMLNFTMNFFKWVISVGVPLLIVFYSHQVKAMAELPASSKPKATTGRRWLNFQWQWAAGLAAKWQIGNAQKQPVETSYDLDVSDVQPRPATQALPAPTPAVVDIELDETDRKLLDLIAAGPALTSALAAAVGMSIPGLYKANPVEKGRLAKLKQAGLIQKTEAGWVVS